MKHEIITIMAALLCGLSIFLSPAQALIGSGTEEDPWRIKSLEDFNDFAADANYWAGFTRLETDVNLAGMVYDRAVIGDPYYDELNVTAFSGVFDGNDHKILNLTIDDGGAGNNFLGLFGRLDDGKVGKLALEGGSVSGDWYVGGLVGINVYGSISDCFFTGSVSGYNGVGGLVGLNDGSVSNCYATGSVRGDWAVGGLVGLAGSLGGNVSNCYATGSVRGDWAVGGLVGDIWEGTVSNCYAIGDVNGVGYIGGLVGGNAYGSVSNCYSIGDVSGRDSNVGGLVGKNREGSISNCFWDTDTQIHGVTDSIGDNQGTATNVAGLPTTQLQQQSTFTDWDFINIWNIGEKQTYPYLRVYLPSD
ncbi:MAG: GLUG motif-containing protein, partial [Planctomycetota bacterium]